MPSPDFLIIGAQKASTTWLQHNLRQHPELWLPDREVHYFDREDNYASGTDWYLRWFQNAPPSAHVGEKTPSYLCPSPGSGLTPADMCQRIARFQPDMKLIAILRNPVERAISAINHMYRTRRLPPLVEIDRAFDARHRHRMEDFGVIERGRYYDHLQPYLRTFGEDRLLVLTFEEDVLAQPEAALAKCCRFLGVDEHAPFPEMQTPQNEHNRSWPRLTIEYYAPPLRPLTRKLARASLRLPALRPIHDHLPARKARPSPAIVQHLYDTYAEPNDRLFQWLGRRIEAWDQPTATAV